MTLISTPSLAPVGTGQRIARLRLWHVPLTSHTAYHMADGKTCDTVETVVVALDTDTGLTGWGEVCPIPHYLPAYTRGVAPALPELAPGAPGRTAGRIAPPDGPGLRITIDEDRLGTPDLILD